MISCMHKVMKEEYNTDRHNTNSDTNEEDTPLLKIVKIIMWLICCDALIEFRPIFNSQIVDWSDTEMHQWVLIMLSKCLIKAPALGPVFCIAAHIFCAGHNTYGGGWIIMLKYF